MTAFETRVPKLTRDPIRSKSEWGTLLGLVSAFRAATSARGRTLLKVVHDYEPTLPWFMYVFTQAQFHQWLMHRFSAHLWREPALVEAVTKSPKALPS